MKNNMNLVIKKRLLMISLGQILSLGFLVGLEFVNPTKTLWLFILLLIGMHGGIILFILSKRIFKLKGNYSSYYNIFYLMLIPFLALMGIKIAKVEMALELEYGLVFSYVALVMIVGIVLDFLFYKKATNDLLIKDM